MRVTGVFTPEDYPGKPDPEKRAEIAELFKQLFPGVVAPRFDKAHAGLAVTAQNPKLALHLARLSRMLLLETAWASRTDLRELAVQTLNHHFNSTYSIKARLTQAAAAGVGQDLLAAIAQWRTSTLLSNDQRLVIEYTEAVISAKVPVELFARVVSRFGETDTIELTTLIGFWSCWAMIINATCPDLDPTS